MTPAAAAEFLRDLERFRRRANRARLVRYTATASAAGLIVVASAALLVRPSGTMTMALLGAAMVAASSVAAIMAFLRRADLRRTASIIDTRCRFDNTVATAVQFATDTDLVSLLVLQQADVRLKQVSPATVFPYDWGLHSKVLTGACVGAVLIVTGASVADLPGWSSRRITGGTSVLPGSPDATRDPKQRSTARVTGRGGDASVSTPAAVPASRISPTTASVDGITQPRSRANSKVNGETTEPQSPAAAPRDPDASDEADGRSAPLVAARRDSRSAQNGSSAARGSAQGSGPAGAAGPTTPGGRTGGVSAGPLASRGADGSRARSTPGYESKYRAAVGRAEEALAREQVPAELREAVRAYFTAIRP